MRGREHWAEVYEAANGFTIVWIVSVLALAALIYPVSVAGWYNNLGNPDGDWVHHLFLRKEAALQLASPAPRVLIVGGSGCLFSIDAEALEREINQPVFNLCSHAGVGLEYMLARARRHARSGDTVLLAPEYRVLINPDPRQTRLEWEYFTTWDRQHYLEHGLPEAYRMLYGIPFGELWKSREGWQKRRAGYDEKLNGSYDVMVMTANGDLHESLGKRPTLLGNLDITFLPPAAYSRELVTEFAHWAQGRGVALRSVYQAVALDPPSHWRTKELFAALPSWWKSMGIEPVGTPETALYPSAGFMDTLQHAGAGISYANAVQIGRALRGKAEAKEWLLVPPHPAQTLLPLPKRDGAAVKTYFGSTEEDEQVRQFQKAGGRVFAATAALAEQLTQRGFRLQAVIDQRTTPDEVFQAHREDIVAICVRPGTPAIPGIDAAGAGEAWAGVWRQGQWALQHGPATAALDLRIQAPLGTGEPIDYRFALRASASTCAMDFQRRDRAPSPSAPVRMLVLDSRRGILRGVYSFGADLRAERSWVGEIAPQ